MTQNAQNRLLLPGGEEMACVKSAEKQGKSRGKE